MAVKTYRAGSGADGNFAALSESDQTAATRADGWTVAKIASGNYSEFDQGTKQASGTFNTTPKPASFLTDATANAFKTPTALSGDFANTSWTLTFAVRATLASSQAGRIRLRVFKSKNADGSSATEITGSTQVGTTSSALSTSADVTTVVTWSPGAFSLSNEYLFFVIAWEITTASGSNSGDVQIRTGQSAGGTRFVTADLAAPTAVSGSDANGTTTESAAITAVKDTDTGVGSDAQTLTRAVISDTDANGATTESATLTAAIVPPSPSATTIYKNGIAKDYDPAGATILPFETLAQDWAASKTFACPQGFAAANAFPTRAIALGMPEDTGIVWRVDRGTWVSGTGNYVRYDKTTDSVDGLDYIAITTVTLTTTRPGLSSQWVRANRTGFSPRVIDAGFYGSVRAAGDATRWFSCEEVGRGKSGSVEPTATSGLTLDNKVEWNVFNIGNGSTVAGYRAGGWQASTAYLSQDYIIENGSFWRCIGSGTSGSSKPNFNANYGSPVDDGVVLGDFQWRRDFIHAGTWAADTFYGFRVVSGGSAGVQGGNDVRKQGVVRSDGRMMIANATTPSDGITGSTEPAWSAAGSGTPQFWEDYVGNGTILWRKGSFDATDTQRERVVITGFAAAADGTVLTVQNPAGAGTKRDVIIADRNVLNRSGTNNLSGSDQASAHGIENSGANIVLTEGQQAAFVYSTSTGLWTQTSVPAAPSGGEAGTLSGESASVSIPPTPISASDTGTSSDSASLSAVTTDSDAGTDSEIATPLYAPSASDSNGTTTEGSSVSSITSVSGSDSGTGTNAESLVFRITVQDNNGSPLTSAQTVTLASGENLIHGSALAKGMLFGSTRSAPAKLFKWANPLTDLSTYTPTTFAASSGEDNADSSYYDGTVDRVFVAFRSRSVGLDTNIKIRSVNPDTLAHTVLVDLQIDAGHDLGILRADPICTDGTHLYLAGFTDDGSGSAVEEACVFKVRLSDGVLVGSRHITGYRQEHAITIDLPNNMLYITGQTRKAAPTLTRWLCRMPTDLSSHTVLEFATDTSAVPGVITDDLITHGSYVWLGHEDSMGSQIRYVAKDLSSSGVLQTNISGTAWGLVSDGVSIWAVFGTNPGTLIEINPAIPAITRTVVTDASFNGSNEVLRLSNSLFITGFTSPAKVQRVNLPATVTETESVSSTNAISASDTNGTTTEANALTAVISTSDANSTTTEIGTGGAGTPISGSDTGSGSDTASLVAVISTSEANGTTTEAGSTGAVVAKTGGALSPSVGGAVEAVAVVKTGGGISPSITGGTRIATAAKSAGGISATIGGATEAILVAKTGGGVSPSVGGGSEIIAIGRTGGGTSPSVGGSPVTTAAGIAKTGGGTSPSVGGSPRAYQVARTGGGVSPSFTGTAKALPVVKTGGGISATIGGGVEGIKYANTGGGISPSFTGISSKFLVGTFPRSGGGFSPSIGGGTAFAGTATSKTGGGRSQASTGGSKAVSAAKSGGSLSPSVGGASRAYTRSQTGGALSPSVAGSTWVERAAKTGGGISPTVGGYTFTTLQIIQKTGGGISATRAGGIGEGTKQIGGGISPSRGGATVQVARTLPPDVTKPGMLVSVSTEGSYLVGANYKPVLVSAGERGELVSVT